MRNPKVTTPSLVKFKTQEIDKVENIIANPKENTHFEKMKIDNYVFQSASQKIIKKFFSQNFNTEVMMASYNKDDSKLVINLIDGAFYFFNNKNPNKSFFHTLNENVPLTSLKWKTTKNFLVGDTEGNLFELEYDKENNTIKTV